MNKIRTKEEEIGGFCLHCRYREIGNYCQVCGSRLVDISNFCMKCCCGKNIMLWHNFCSNCGKPTTTDEIFRYLEETEPLIEGKDASI